MVERFNFICEFSAGGYPEALMFGPTPAGIWVRFSDYDDLLAERDELARFAHEATKALTGLTGGGSEFFSKEVAGVYLADLPRCVERIRAKFEARRAADSVKGAG